MKKEKGLCNEKQMSFDEFLIDNFKKKLEELSKNLSKSNTGRPLIIYTTLLDEENEYGEQELLLLMKILLLFKSLLLEGMSQYLFSINEFLHLMNSHYGFLKEVVICFYNA